MKVAEDSDVKMRCQAWFFFSPREHEVIVRLSFRNSSATAASLPINNMMWLGDRWISVTITGKSIFLYHNCTQEQFMLLFRVYKVYFLAYAKNLVFCLRVFCHLVFAGDPCLQKFHKTWTFLNMRVLLLGTEKIQCKICTALSSWSVPCCGLFQWKCCVTRWNVILWDFPLISGYKFVESSSLITITKAIFVRIWRQWPHAWQQMQCGTFLSVQLRAWCNRTILLKSYFFFSNPKNSFVMLLTGATKCEISFLCRLCAVYVWVRICIYLRNTRTCIYLRMWYYPKTFPVSWSDLFVPNNWCFAIPVLILGKFLSRKLTQREKSRTK